MSVEEDLKKQAVDINVLTVNMTRLSTIVENSEKRHESDMAQVKEAVAGISRINERLSATVSMEKDITQIKDTIAERSSDIRTIRHDMNNIANGMQGLPVLNEKIQDNAKNIVALNARLEAIVAKTDNFETWKDKFDGAANAIRVMVNIMWAIFGTALVAGFGFVVRFYIMHTQGLGGE